MNLSELNMCVLWPRRLSCETQIVRSSHIEMTSSKPTLIFLTSDLGCEVAIGSFTRFILPKSVHIKLSRTELSTGEYLKTTVIPSFQKQYPEGFSLYMFGDFFTKPFIVEALDDVDEILKTWAYTFDQKTRERGANGWVEACTDQSPLDAVISIAKEHRKWTPIDDFVLKQHSEFISMLDNRALGVNVEATQALFAGLYETSTKDKVDLDEKIYQVFCGHINLGDVTELGATILKNQRNLARERALKNARTGTFADGTKYVVTDAPELVNLTHGELLREHPDVHVTICTKLLFESGQPDRIAHSMRSWNKKVSVKRIIGERGGGSDTAAGGTTEVDVKIDY